MFCEGPFKGNMFPSGLKHEIRLGDLIPSQQSDVFLPPILLSRRSGEASCQDFWGREGGQL